jgi:hypothetical protein
MTGWRGSWAMTVISAQMVRRNKEDQVMPKNHRSGGARGAGNARKGAKPSKTVEAVANARIKRVSTSSIADLFGWTYPTTRSRIRLWRKRWPGLFPKIEGDERISL